MSKRTHEDGVPSSPPHRNAPTGQADLFSTLPAPSVAPAWPTETTDRRLAARQTDGPPAPPAAPDRPAEPFARRPASLAGEYARHGQNLRRADGLALIVCLSTRPATGRRAGRYVRTVGPGLPIRYAGTLYADGATGRCDLDGTQFQDRDTGTRYQLNRRAADRYAVAPVASRRRGRSGL